jgi:hypothetical protein
MSISSNYKRGPRKASFALSGAATITSIFIALSLLAASAFALISSTITPMTSIAAFAQEGNNTTSTPTLNNPTNTTTASSDIELSPQPIYQEHVRDVSETLINQTHAHLIVEANGTLTLPSITEPIKTISTGSGIVSIIGSFAGQVILSTEDGSENATAISYEIARSNKEEGVGKGIAIAVIHTNSTGRLAPLDGMILAGQEEFQPDGRALLTYWEWQSGIPLSPTNTEEPSMMSTITMTNATDDANATGVTGEE